MASTLLCCLKKKHTARERVSPREKKRRTQRKRKGSNKKKTLKNEDMKHILRLNYIFSFFLFLSNKLSYDRIIICIIYNIQCSRRLRKYLLLTMRESVWCQRSTTLKRLRPSAASRCHVVLDYTINYITHSGIPIRYYISIFFNCSHLLKLGPDGRLENISFLLAQLSTSCA